MYLSNEKTPVFYEDLLKTIHEIENTLEETFTNDCINTTEEMMCHYFFPSCGNSTVFEFPTSVCPSDCEEQRHKCPSQWTWFTQKLSSAVIHQLDNCSHTTFTQNMTYSCSSLGKDICKFWTLLQLIMFTFLLQLLTLLGMAREQMKLEILVYSSLQQLQCL